MARYCPACRTELQIESAPSCPSCGAPLAEEASPPARGAFHGAARYLAIFSAALFIAFFIFAALSVAIMVPRVFFPTEPPEGAGLPVYGHAGEGAATAEFLGSITGRGRCSDGTCHEINYLEFTLGLAPGGIPLDLITARIAVMNATTPARLRRATPLQGTDPGPGEWSIAGISNGDDDALLEGGEQVDILVHLPESTGAIAGGDLVLIDIIPATGQPISVSPVAPRVLDPVNALRP